jgi:lipoyl-dependent peroxiredoxin
MSIERSATAVWKGTLFEGSGTFTVGSGAIPEQPVSWPARTEEASGGKTSPEELVAAAHSSCFSMALSNQLAQNGTPADSLTVTATVGFSKTDAGWRIKTINLDVEGAVPGIEESVFLEKAAAAKTGCPISNALSDSIAISMDARLS